MLKTNLGFFLIFGLSIICFTLSQEVADYGCRNNEKYTRCAQPKACMTCINRRKCPTFTCTAGCDCIEGYFRDRYGNCIPSNQCSPQKDFPCERNEIYNKCAQPLGCVTCTNPRRCQTYICTEGCDCREGYYRNYQGKCIPQVECEFERSRRCPPNELFSNCVEPRVCMTCEMPYHCTPLICDEGCQCIQGYYRDEHGTCIPRQQCPVPEGLCGEDEAYYDAVPNCKNTCENWGNPGIRCAFGPEGCFCKEGYVKREDGKCVRFEDCGQTCSGVNEEYTACGSACPRTCANYNDNEYGCIQSCQKGCFCKEGYIRNNNGECVLPSQCNQDCKDPNAVFLNCSSICNDCERKDQCSPPFVCQPGCNCIPGYFSHDGICVPESACPPSSTGEFACSEIENEVVVPCAKPKWCNTCGIRGNCKMTQCNSGCDCASDYYRNADGVCIPSGSCPTNY